jgi:hypothetical protein
MWINIKEKLPEIHKEVLVWVDGHRRPAWSNNYALVAYMESDGVFWEEMHDEIVIGVTHWMEYQKP